MPSGDHHASTFSPWSIIDFGVRERKDNTAEGLEQCQATSELN